MPQLDPSTFSPQLFWLAITFVALYLIMWRVALPRISDVLQERQERIDDDLQKAEQLKVDADEVLRSYERAMAEGRAKAQQVLHQGAEKIAAESAERHAALGEKVAGQMAEAEARIAAERDAALANVRSVAAEVAAAAATRLTGAEIPAAEAEAAVGASMEERG
ncbi:MAG: F0F1 ATP synthase subunit B' [Alphaproteobacteria bacterium]|nr:F0F1 ATP synthase subunit B' [Alphaproteobacteria bacterium]